MNADCRIIVRTFRERKVAMNQRQDILTLQDVRELISPILRKYGVIRALVFGSYARGEATLFSDVDIVIDSGGRLKGMDFFIASDEISKALPLPSDIYERREIKEGSPLHEKINKEGVLLYER